jgi:hypothetical protein
MAKLHKAGLHPRGYVMPEEGREKLEHVRDQLFLIAEFVFAATLEEDNSPLEIRRSMLGQLLDSFGLRIDEVLTTLEWSGHLKGSPRHH